MVIFATVKQSSLLGNTIRSIMLGLRLFGSSPIFFVGLIFGEKNFFIILLFFEKVFVSDFELTVGKALVKYKVAGVKVYLI